MGSILDFMSENDRQKAISSFERRMNMERRNYGKISPEIYLIAELGYYYGWGAIEAVKRGYVESFNEETGKREKQIITLDEMSALVEGARKVWFSKVIDSARGTQIATGSVLSKHPSSAFKRGMKPFEEAAKLERAHDG